ncbi:hypothetical protein GCM10011321_39480 [Youhaiella tibetensis]|uniref:Flp family type IVb pilin n=1 Tax=Paradevosia tibetensis TaxID=1447062 RepID=A0A5B9DT53_9HYPH|nr:Flp family type IVb pilin [Youhaiella tibetensis]AKR57180.1 hypothetical protein XM25_15575 [Devosia sp. H5989]QEE22125.1 Flp family type IVb pilin [Youhaiella tibetensis]GGF45036.1 hypothetical protein GCM10011321_39480 [Youhaiella tibetensis]
MLERTLKRFAADEAGATAIEYSLIAALIAMIAITAMIALGGGTSGLFNYVTEKTSAALTMP